MNSDSKIKENVKQKYGQIARGEISAIAASSACCEPGVGSCCGTGASSVIQMSGEYDSKDLENVPEGADLGLGCGVPTAFANLKEGDTVLDLGSGAGVDVFVSARHVGSTGKVIGVDMTEAMIAKARSNAKKINATNVEFRLGEIEALPVENDSVDHVISNCVINLVPNKDKAFREIYRVLKKGGDFTISDIVVDGTVTNAERMDASLWAGCISGAIDRKDYLAMIRGAGFRSVDVVSERKYDYRLENAGLHSITVTGTK